MGLPGATISQMEVNKKVNSIFSLEMQSYLKYHLLDSQNDIWTSEPTGRTETLIRNNAT